MDNLTFADARLRIKKQDNPVRDSNLKTVTYLENLAIATGHVIKTWSVNPFLTTERRANALEFMTDKNTLNRIFFETSEKAQKATDHPALKELDARINETVKINDQTLDVQIRELNSRINRGFEQIGIWDKDILKLLTRKKTPETGETLRQKLALALHSTPEFFKFERTYGDAIYFETKRVVLGIKNPASGVDFCLPFGTFEVRIHIFSRQIKIFGDHDFAIPANDCEEDFYYHPYVSTDGNPCFGSVSDTVMNAQKNGDFLTILRLTEKLLTTYDTESMPHRNLSQFKSFYEDAHGDAPKFGHVFDESEPTEVSLAREVDQNEMPS